MDLKKGNVTKALMSVKSPAGDVSITERGELKNIQIFAKDVDVDLEVKSPALNIRKNLEADVTNTLIKAFVAGFLGLFSLHKETPAVFNFQ
jgi:ATP-binding protein involved in chromosome partitioning